MRSDHQRMRGMTLIEILITTAILLITAGLLFLMIVKTKTGLQASTNRSSSRGDLQVVTWKIARELQTSNATLITDGSASGLKAFSFISAFDPKGQFITDNLGQLVWQKYVIYYIEPSSMKLKRKEVYQDFLTNPATLVPLTQSALAAQCDGKGTVVLPSAASLSLTPGAGGTIFTLFIATHSMSTHGTVDTQSRKMNVFLYNNQRR
jgi:prepilin-type N-terminal cleavage/methylation domain-containing protein